MRAFVACQTTRKAYLLPRHKPPQGSACAQSRALLARKGELAASLALVALSGRIVNRGPLHDSQPGRLDQGADLGRREQVPLSRKCGAANMPVETGIAAALVW